MKDDGYSFGVEKECPICGKEFLFRTDWGFKRIYFGKTLNFCSWGCLRKWEKSGPIGSKQELRDRICQALKDGLTVKEVSVLLDVKTDRVLYWRQKLKIEGVI